MRDIALKIPDAIANKVSPSNRSPNLTGNYWKQWVDMKLRVALQEKRQFRPVFFLDLTCGPVHANKTGIYSVPSAKHGDFRQATGPTFYKAKTDHLVDIFTMCPGK